MAQLRFLGLSSVSGFGGGGETVENLEFKDNYSGNIDAEDPNYMYTNPNAQISECVVEVCDSCDTTIGAKLVPPSYFFRFEILAH